LDHPCRRRVGRDIEVHDTSALMRDDEQCVEHLLVVGDRPQALALQIEQAVGEVVARVLVELSVRGVVHLNFVIEPVEEHGRRAANEFGQAVARQGMAAVVAQIESANDPVFVADCDSCSRRESALHVHSCSLRSLPGGSDLPGTRPCVIAACNMGTVVCTQFIVCPSRRGLLPGRRIAPSPGEFRCREKAVARIFSW
jgi:hypothetical protein